MRKALLLFEYRSETQGKYTDKIDRINPQNFPKIAPVLSKKQSKETLKVSVNGHNDSKEKLKIIRTINEHQNTESYRYKLANTNQTEESFDFCQI